MAFTVKVKVKVKVLHRKDLSLKVLINSVLKNKFCKKSFLG